MTKFNPRARHRARKMAVQALYQWQLTQEALGLIEKQFLSHEYAVDADIDYFSTIIKGIAAACEDIDAKFSPFLDRPLVELSPVELAILRVAIFELENFPEIPYRVILNEAVELAKMFGAAEGYKYVNGVLDKAAAQIRQIEQM